MYAIRGKKSGLTFTDKNGKEILYEQLEEARRVKETYEKTFPDQEFYIHEVRVGRPAIGVTKRVSLTLPEDVWEWLDKQANGNRSKFLRQLVLNAKEEEEVD